MSDSIKKVLLKDDIIATESAVEYAVLSGAQNVTAQEFKAISATPNSFVFNVVCMATLVKTTLKFFG